MSKLPVWFWVVVGAGILLAYSFGHRYGQAKAVSAEALRQSNEASVPLQEYTQPQPSQYAYGASPYGDTAHGGATSTPTGPALQLNYQTAYGAFVG